MADNASSYLQAARQTQDLRKQKPLSSRQINSMTANDSNTYNIYDTSNHKNTKKQLRNQKNQNPFWIHKFWPGKQTNKARSRQTNKARSYCLRHKHKLCKCTCFIQKPYGLDPAHFAMNVCLSWLLRLFCWTSLLSLIFLSTNTQLIPYPPSYLPHRSLDSIKSDGKVS